MDQETGRIAGYKTNVGGADTEFPFNRSNITLIKDSVTLIVKTNTSATNSSINIDVKEIIDDYEDLTVDNFFVIVISYTCAISASRVTLSRSYDASTGTFTMKAAATASDWNNRNSNFVFDLYCIR